MGYCTRGDSDMVVKTTRTDGAISEDARQFAQENRILEYLEKAMRAVREVYADGEPISASLKTDGEYGHSFVEIHVRLRDGEQPETAAAKDSACYEKWAAFLPAEIDIICLS